MNNWRATIGYMLPSSCLVYEHEFQLITASLPGVIGVRVSIAKLEIFDDCEVAIRVETGQW